MRDLYEVIRQMLEIIPEDKGYLRNQLNEYLNSKELKDEDWNDIGDLLFREVFNDYYPEEKWMHDLDIIWIGDEDPYDLSNSNF